MSQTSRSAWRNPEHRTFAASCGWSRTTQPRSTQWFRESFVAMVGDLFVKPYKGLLGFSVLLDKPVTARVAADKHVCKRIGCDRVCRVTVLENVNRDPRARGAYALANHPMIFLSSIALAGHEHIPVRVLTNAARLAGAVGDELVIIRCCPGVATIGALARDPVGGPGSFVDGISATQPRRGCPRHPRRYPWRRKAANSTVETARQAWFWTKKVTPRSPSSVRNS